MNENNAREEIIKKENFDKSFFVEAGAGAGKTSLIVKRIVNQLKAGFIPERIVAITFTNAAARQLKTRIYDAIENEMNTSVSKDEKNNLENALLNLDRMQISTIHGFCHRILTEKCFDAGLPMGFKLIEEDEEEKIFNHFFTDWIEKNLKYDDWNNLTNLKTDRRSAYGRLKRLARELAFLSDDVEIKVSGIVSSSAATEASLNVIFTEAENKLDNVAAALPGGSYTFRTAPQEDCFSKPAKEFYDALCLGDSVTVAKKILGLKKVKGVLKASKAQFESYYLSQGCTKADSKKKVDEAKQDFDSRNSAVVEYVISKEKEINDLLLTRQNEIFSPYVDIAKKIAKGYKEYFPDNIVTNDLLLRKTYHLMINSDKVRDYYADKFDCIYVDEFQDTDHIQESFIRMFAMKPGEPDSLRDGALFVVGDPKQSIYRFRGAQPEVYFKTRDWMAGLGNAMVCGLNYNFRSNPVIIDWVNKVFQTQNITDGNKYVPMTLLDSRKEAFKDNKKDNNQNLVSGVYKYISPEDSGDKKLISQDADAVCRLINGMVDKAEIIVNGEPKTVAYSDFLILSANMNGMNIYSDAMQLYGIPFTMNGRIKSGYDYYINAFIRLYAFMANPFERRAKEGALETLDISGLSRKASERVLNNIREMTSKMNGYGCLQFLMNHKEFIILKGKETDSYEMASMNRKLVQMTESVLSSSHMSKEDILNALIDFSEKDIERELVLEEEPNAVRFMNLHKAKGLEGKIVIWSNRIENRSFRKGSYMNHSATDDKYQYYPQVTDENSYQNASVWCGYDSDQTLIDAATKEDNCERIRLEYVAATRAENVLIFMDNYSAKSLFCENYNLSDLPSIDAWVDGTPRNTNSTGINYPMVSLTEENEKCEKNTEYSEKQYESVTPSELEKKTESKGVEKTEVESDRVRGNIIGLAMHRCFELVLERGNTEYSDAVGLDSPGVLKMCMLQALNENRADIPEAQYNKYREFLEEALNAFGSWFVKWDVYKKAEAIYTELPFFYMKDGKIPVWMHGEADLIIKYDGDSYYIIDYKSDDDTKYDDEKDFLKHLKDKYTSQVCEYRKAVSTLFNVPENKIGVSLVSFSSKLGTSDKMGIRVTEI